MLKAITCGSIVASVWPCGFPVPTATAPPPHGEGGAAAAAGGGTEEGGERV
eukprot:SAG11_NODE_3950_length_2136_cov_2.977909_3_plen_50_part_01